MKQSFVLIYVKEGEIKVLSLDESERLHENLIKNNWKHVQTLDACVWVKYLLENCEAVDLYDEVMSLLKVSS